MPILSVLLGYIFFKEKLNKKRIFSIFLVLISILILLILVLSHYHGLVLLVGISWAFYNLIRKKLMLILILDY